MTTPANYPLDIYRGDTFKVMFKLWRDKNKVDPVDLTGAQVSAQVRATANSAVLVTFVIAITLPNTIVMSLSPAESAKLPTSGYWDLQVVYANKDVQTVLAGAVKVILDITRSA